MAIASAKLAASDLMNMPYEDGHLALCLTALQPLEQITDLTPFPLCGAQRRGHVEYLHNLQDVGPS